MRDHPDGSGIQRRADQVPGVQETKKGETMISLANREVLAEAWKVASLACLLCSKGASLSICVGEKGIGWFHVMNNGNFPCKSEHVWNRTFEQAVAFRKPEEEEAPTPKAGPDLEVVKGGAVDSDDA